MKSQAFIHSFKAYSGDSLRVAVVANFQARPDLRALLDEDVHLLLTAGDMIGSTHALCGEGTMDCVKPFAELIDLYPELFSSTIFMPTLGNHDREMRPRGNRPPALPVYDVAATAYRKFFTLPGDEWKWYFDIPRFGVRFVSLDFNHITDMGSTWQSCHPIDQDSEQYVWYGQRIAERGQPFLVTLYNEKNDRMRITEGGIWGELFERSDVCIAGYGYFGEQAQLGATTFYNTSLNGRGDRYPDPHALLTESVDNFVLLTLDAKRKEAVAALKSLDGKVLAVSRHSWD